jgi:hypothetical protein
VKGEDLRAAGRMVVNAVVRVIERTWMPTDQPDRLLASAIKKAESLEGPYAYAGVSWRDLERYNRYEDLASGFVLTEEDRKLTQLYAALSVYTRDVFHALSAEPRADAAAFLEVVASISDDERRRYGTEAFPYDDPAFPHRRELAAFPKDLAVLAGPGRDVLSALSRGEIRHE